MNNEREDIEKNIKTNKLVKYIENDDYEPLKMKVYHRRKKRLDYWLRYAGLALLFEFLCLILDLYAKSEYTFAMVSDNIVEIIAMGFSVISLLLLLVAFVYLFNARKSKIMKDIRTHELL